MRKRFISQGPKAAPIIPVGDPPASLGVIHRQCLAGFPTAEYKDIEMFTAIMGHFLSKVIVIALLEITSRVTQRWASSTSS